MTSKFITRAYIVNTFADLDRRNQWDAIYRVSPLLLIIRVLLYIKCALETLLRLEQAGKGA